MFQAANSIATVALEMKSGLSEHRQELIEMLLDALKGRTWKGKEKLLQALANLCRFVSIYCLCSTYIYY